MIGFNKKYLALLSIFIVACAAPKTEIKEESLVVDAPKGVSEHHEDSAANNAQSFKNASDLPNSYKDIVYPEFKYIAPYPDSFRVELSDNITGFIVSDSSLPLISFQVYFKETTVPQKLSETASLELLSPMFRLGGSTKISAKEINDSLEFVSASISGSVGTFYSQISIDCLSKDFQSMLLLSKDIFTKPAFEKEQLEIQKSAFINAYERRFDTPERVLSSLRRKVNYAPSPRFFDPTVEEYKKVNAKDLKSIGASKFTSNRVVFSVAGDISKDSALVLLKEYFKDWKFIDKKEEPPVLRLQGKPGVYVVEKDLTQASISLNQAFVKRPHPDYYPAAVASFILGGGSFSSRLTTKVRSDEGLAYSIYSSVGNNYNDTALTTIALQTKVESVGLAIELIQKEIEKLIEKGPSPEEMDLAKKTLIESLPSLFDSPASTASIFALDELVGKSKDHYLEYVKEINAVTPVQVQEMVAKYFDFKKMTISIVGPPSAWKDFENVTVIPIKELYFRE